MEHVKAGYLRQVWDMSEWLYEGQHGFRPGCACESQIVTVCQYIAGYLDKGARIKAIVIDFFESFRISSVWLAVDENYGFGRGF
jgi:hypothetical protein